MLNNEEFLMEISKGNKPASCNKWQNEIAVNRGYEQPNKSLSIETPQEINRIKLYPKSKQKTTESKEINIEEQVSSIAKNNECDDNCLCAEAILAESEKEGKV